MTEKKGCRTAVWVLMVASAIGVSISGLLVCAGGDRTSQTGQADFVVGTIDGQELTMAQIDIQIQAARGQSGQVSDPFSEYQILAGALQTSVAQLVITSLAVARNVVITDEQAVAMASSEVDAALTQFRSRAQAGGVLKPGATEQEFQEFFKSQQGMTTAEFKEGRINDMKKGLAEPVRRGGILAAYYQQALQNDYYTKTLVTDDEVKKSYDAFMVKSISFDRAGLSDDQRKKDAATARAEIIGGADFDAVMKKYMTTQAKEPTKIPRASLESTEPMKPILALAPGGVSEVIDSFGVPRIYKLVEIKSELPKDFEASKTLFSDTYRRQKAMQEMQKVLMEAIKTAKIEWKSAGFGLVYKVAAISSQADLSNAAVKAELQSVVAVVTDPVIDPYGLQPARLARYLAAEQLNSIFDEKERVAFLPKYAEIVLDILATTENIDLRLRLADTYEQLGNKVAMTDALKSAAINNSGFEESNTDAFNRIHTKVTKLEVEKKIDPADAQQIRTILNEWSARKMEADALQQKSTTDLDQFNIDPATGKPLPSPADEAAKKILDQANKPKSGG